MTKENGVCFSQILNGSNFN